MQDKLLELLDEIETIADDVQWYDQVIANRLIKITLEIKTLRSEQNV